MYIPSAPITFNASPFASSMAKSLRVTLLEVTKKPCAPDSCSLKDRIVLLLPEPCTITLFTSRDNPSLKSNTPSDKVKLNLVIFLSVISNSFFFFILKNNGITDPLEFITFPYLTTEKFILPNPA